MNNDSTDSIYSLKHKVYNVDKNIIQPNISNLPANIPLLLVSPIFLFFISSVMTTNFNALISLLSTAPFIY